MKTRIHPMLSLFAVAPFAAVLFTGCASEKTDPEPDKIVTTGPGCIGCSVGNTSAMHGARAGADLGAVAVAEVELPDGRRFAATR